MDPSLLAWFVPHTTTLRLILATTVNVTDQPVSIKEALLYGRESVVDGSGRGPVGSVEAGLDKGPATSHPVTVATINELVGTTRETTLGGILARREPGDKQWNIQVASRWERGQHAGFHVTTSVGNIVGREKTYRGILLCGESRIERHPRAQNAYAPCASTPGFADTPPSYV